MTFSNGCDAYTVPLGEPTTNISRPLIGNVTYGGEGIEQCMNDGDIALTFDDGPFNFTSHLLDVLASYGAKATFFITGNNLGKGQIDVEETGWPDVIRRMHREGHQIAAHTWTHQNLSSLNEGDMENQVVYVEMALRNILGFFPTYMRPPYSECSDACQALMKKMGYHITYQNLVTFGKSATVPQQHVSRSHCWLFLDWDNDNDTRIQLSKDNFTAKMNKVTPSDINYITLNHDTHYQTTYNLSTYMLDYLNSMNFSKSVTVGQCMGDPQENWYRMAGGAPNRTLLVSERDSMQL
jgi:peptidoglycan/xylan/chitin deacetylase (PgdA/CDA1 family)